MTLTLLSPIVDIDRRVATRRTGFRTKGDEAWVVLDKIFSIATVGDLLHHYPRRYIDRSRVQTIRDLKIDQYVTVIAAVKKVAKRPTRRHQTMVTVTLYDGTGHLDLVFFNQPWTASVYKEGSELAVSGVPGMYRGKLQLANQEVEVLRADGDLVHMGRITPVHPAGEGISTRTIRELIHLSLAGLAPIKDPLPEKIVSAESLGSYDWALRHIHFPADPSELNRAQERLKFDELFLLELGVAFRKARLQAESTGVAHSPSGPMTRALAETLPFKPTSAQEVAMRDIGEAMARPHPMNVLLQGDVGSGKTVVALHAALIAVGSGHQAAIMAPTEVLAGQHFRSIGALLGPMGARAFLEGSARPGQPSLLEPPEEQGSEPSLYYALLTAAVTGKDRQRILQGVADGLVDLVVGTHALVQEAVSFHDLSLAVVDEQHRFGLHQRMALKGKGGGDIDVLIMTATPIPRTLALTYYGDLDVVTLDEMPGGRRPIKTLAVREEPGRRDAEELVRAQVGEGRQAFVVCAAIDDGNRTLVKAAEV